MCKTDRCLTYERYREDSVFHTMNTNEYCCICRDRMDWVFTDNQIGVELRASGYCPNCLEIATEILEKIAEDGEFSGTDYRLIEYTSTDELKVRGYIR